MDRGRRCCLHASPVRPGRHRYPASGSWAPHGNVAFPSPQHCDPWWRPGKLGIWMGVWLAVAKNLLQVGMCLKNQIPLWIKKNELLNPIHGCLILGTFKVSLIYLILQNTCIFHMISQVPWFFSQNQRWFRRPEHLKTMTNRKDRKLPDLWAHQGIPNLTSGRMTLEKELKEFHEYHKKVNRRSGRIFCWGQGRTVFRVKTNFQDLEMEIDATWTLIKMHIIYMVDVDVLSYVCGTFRPCTCPVVHLRFAFLAEHMKLRCVNQKACQNFTIHLWFTNQHVKNIYTILQLYIIPEKKSPTPKKVLKSTLPENGFPPKNWRISILLFRKLDFQFFPALFLFPTPTNPGGKSQR